MRTSESLRSRGCSRSTVAPSGLRTYGPTGLAKSFCRGQNVGCWGAPAQFELEKDALLAVRRHVRLPEALRPETLKGADAFLQRRCAMVTNPSDIDRFARGVTGALADGWRFLLIEGIVLAALGAAAIIFPPIATLAVEIILGWLFFIPGLLVLVMTFLMRHAPGF